jgi:ribosome-associated protein
MQTEELKDLAVTALEDLKAVELKTLDVHEMTTVTDWMVIASGTSDRHVKSLADNVVSRAKEAGVRPLGVEGERQGEWSRSSGAASNRPAPKRPECASG